MRYSIVPLEKAFVIIVYLLMFWFLMGCTSEYHLRRAAKHTEKAIKKGYKPLHDEIKNQAEISLKYSTDYTSALKPRILIKLDSFDITPEDKEKVSNIVVYEVEKAKESIELDSVITIDHKGDSIGFVYVRVKGGKIKIGYSISYPKPIVYTETFWQSIGISKFWQGFFKVFFILIIIAIVALWIYKQLPTWRSGL